MKEFSQILGTTKIDFNEDSRRTCAEVENLTFTLKTVQKIPEINKNRNKIILKQMSNNASACFIGKTCFVGAFLFYFTELGSEFSLKDSKNLFQIVQLRKFHLTEILNY